MTTHVRSRRLFAAAATSVLLALVAPALATHGDSCSGAVSQVGDLYVQTRPGGNVEYREYNGSPGLQPGGADEIGWKADLCGSGSHDQLVTCNDKHNCILL